MIDDNDGQMIFGHLGSLKLPDICHTGEENSEKISPRKLVLTGNRTRCVTGAHGTACPTAEYFNFKMFVRISFRYVFMYVYSRFLGRVNISGHWLP